MTRWLVIPTRAVRHYLAHWCLSGHCRPARPFDNYTATILHWSIQPFDNYPNHLACSHNGLGTCNWAVVSSDWASQQGRSNKDMDTGCRNSLRTKNRKLLVVIVIIIVIMIHNHLLHHPSAWKRHQGGAGPACEEGCSIFTLSLTNQRRPYFTSCFKTLVSDSPNEQLQEVLRLKGPS